MSKSIMIVICDFLLLSLLSLANFDSPQSEDAAMKVKEESMRQQAFADSQMLDLLKMSLDSERDRRMEINADVSKLAKVAEENKNLAERQKKILDARERELKQLAKTKSDLEKERIKILSQSRDLESRVESTEKRNQRLQEEIMSASARLEKSAQERLTLEKRLGDMKQMDSSTKQKLEAVQTELRLNKEYLEKLKVEGEALKSENRAIETEKRALATQLEVATTKTQIYEENIKRYQTLVDIEKNEKEKIREHAETLAVGVGELATQQEKLTQNVRDLRPQTSSEIFENIKSRFVNVIFAYTKKRHLRKIGIHNRVAGNPRKNRRRNMARHKLGRHRNRARSQSPTVFGSRNPFNFRARQSLQIPALRNLFDSRRPAPARASSAFGLRRKGKNRASETTGKFLHVFGLRRNQSVEILLRANTLPRRF